MIEHPVQQALEDFLLGEVVRAETLFDRRIPLPSLTFDLSGSCAGMASAVTWNIRLNPVLLSENFEDYLTSTIPHELAHLIADKFFSSRGHDSAWTWVMRKMGVAPERCHSYDTSSSVSRKFKRFPLHCSCRTHQVTKVIINRMKKGRVYTCTDCGDTLSLS